MCSFYFIACLAQRTGVKLPEPLKYEVRAKRIKLPFAYSSIYFSVCLFTANPSCREATLVYLAATRLSVTVSVGGTSETLFLSTFY